MAKRKGKFLDFYNSVVGQEGYSARRVLDEINGYCHIPEGTFNQTINKNMEKNFNPLVVLAFCKTYGFDIDDIFRDEGSGKQENPSLPTQAGMDVADSELPNRFDLPNSFDGKFFGYSFNTTTDYTKQGKLDQFILDIDTNNQKITMTLRHFALNSSQRYSPREITMRGRVIHNENGKAPNGVLAITFNSEDGTKFCTLAYNKLQLHGPLYFRKGAMLIYARGDNAPMPVMQSFIFTHRKIDLEIPSNRTILQGALALTDGKIWLRKNDLDAFMDSETMQKYFEQVSYENAIQEYVELNETILLGLDVSDRDKLYLIFLQLKAAAVNPRLFKFPNSGTDRSWRCVAALGKEESQKQEGESQVSCEEELDIGVSGRISTEDLTFSQEAEFSQEE